jgi:hypothetical protein
MIEIVTAILKNLRLKPLGWEERLQWKLKPMKG